MFGAILEIDGLAASMAAAMISTAGILAIYAFGDAAERYGGNISAFAVGLLTVGVVFHLIPEALESTLSAFNWVLGGFTAMIAIGVIVQLTVGPHRDGAALTFGYASIAALAAHSFIDGVIYSAAFHDEPFTGWITAGGLMLHEFPEGVIAFFMLVTAGFSRLRAALFAFVAAAVTTVAGTLAATVAIWRTAELPLSAMLGAAAGALIYVLVFHLTPHAVRSRSKHGFLFAQLGVVISTTAIIINSLNGGHAH